MSIFTENWRQLYDCQTETLKDASIQDDGTRLATVGEVTGPCILGINAINGKLELDAFSTEGGFDFQMLASDFPQAPPEQAPVNLPGRSNLYVEGANLNNGIWYFTARERNSR